MYMTIFGFPSIFLFTEIFRFQWSAERGICCYSLYIYIMSFYGELVYALCLLAVQYTPKHISDPGSND